MGIGCLNNVLVRYYEPGAKVWSLVTCEVATRSCLNKYLYKHWYAICTSPSEISSFLIIGLWQQIGLKSQLQFNSIRGFQDDDDDDVNLWLTMSSVDTESKLTSHVVGYNSFKSC